MLDEHFGRARHDMERVTGAPSDVEQAMVPSERFNGCNAPPKSSHRVELLKREI